MPLDLLDVSSILAASLSVLAFLPIPYYSPPFISPPTHILLPPVSYLPLYHSHLMHAPTKGMLTNRHCYPFQFYIGIIREETTRTVEALPIGQRNRLQARADSAATSTSASASGGGPGGSSFFEHHNNGHGGFSGDSDADAGFGYLWVELEYPVGPDFDRMTLGQATALEWRAIDQVLRRAMNGGPIPEAYMRGGAIAY
ncbi:hypothetical protein GGR56DRAFT_469214 [Xylariaceae sp. FL0804]|nr:hypothetical protein GGR56DRAFT_469214 [Xylariaceae sp. FL0804]